MQPIQTMSTATVLILEDDLEISRLLKDVLALTEANPFIVFTRSLPEASFQIINKNLNPDLVIVNVKVPGGIGTDICNDLKPEIPYIISTGLAFQECDPTIVEKAFELLVKPYDIDELISVVNKALSGKAAVAI